MNSSQNLDDWLTPMQDGIMIATKQNKVQNFDIILSKYLNNLQLTDVELQQLSQEQRLVLDQVDTKSKKKRPDEYHKLFFKKAFKFAQNKFFKNKKNKTRRMSQFYHHYFDNTANAMAIPLINFYHPDRKTRPGYKTPQKSFNNAYIRLLLRSSVFKQISREYHRGFIEECIKDRDKKIGKFTNSMTRAMQRLKDKRQQIIRYMQSSQCKIPWTNSDIQEAWKRAQEELNEDMISQAKYEEMEEQSLISESDCD